MDGHSSLTHLAEAALDRLGDNPSLWFEGRWHTLRRAVRAGPPGRRRPAPARRAAGRPGRGVHGELPRGRRHVPRDLAGRRGGHAGHVPGHRARAAPRRTSTRARSRSSPRPSWRRGRSGRARRPGPADRVGRRSASAPGVDRVRRAGGRGARRGRRPGRRRPRRAALHRRYDRAQQGCAAHPRQPGQRRRRRPARCPMWRV